MQVNCNYDVEHRSYKNTDFIYAFPSSIPSQEDKNNQVKCHYHAEHCSYKNMDFICTFPHSIPSQEDINNRGLTGHKPASEEAFIWLKSYHITCHYRISLPFVFLSLSAVNISGVCHRDYEGRNKKKYFQTSRWLNFC